MTCRRILTQDKEMSLIKRNLENTINRLLKTFPAVLILGVRQCGKSTLARMVRPDWKYFDLENSRDFDYISADPDFFLRENPAGIILDEAQELPGVFKNLRGIIDKQRSTNNRFILTGSSSPELLKFAGDSLAGRIAVIELGTFKMNELNNVQLPGFYRLFEDTLSEKSIGFLKSLETVAVRTDAIDYFLEGGYPDPVLSKDRQYFADWMDNYFRTFINSDIRKLFPRLDSLKYRRFVNMLSGLSGTIINKAQLGRSLDINEVTVRDYLEIADNTFIWRIIPSYEKTKIKSVVKMPKGIMRDSGLLHYLSFIDSREKLLRSPAFGQNFESFIIEEILKGLEASPVPRPAYYYYRTKNGIEVDLILEGHFGVLPVEIKAGSSASIKDLRSLVHFVEDQNLPLGIVINNDTEIKALNDKIIQVPAGCI